jgi:hypothetical protein
MATTYDISLTSGLRQIKQSGFFANLFARFVEARQKQANRHILFYLMSLDADSLSRLGYNPTQIQRILSKKRAYSSAHGA